MNDRCGRTLLLTPPLRGGSFPLPSEGGRLKMFSVHPSTKPGQLHSFSGSGFFCCRRARGEARYEHGDDGCVGSHGGGLLWKAHQCAWRIWEATGRETLP